MIWTETMLDKLINLLMIMFLVILLVFFPYAFYKIMTDQQKEVYCRGGYLHNTSSGRQIISENGGGIKCETQQ